MKKQSLWLLAAAVITIIFGMIYGVGQQILRMSANDPQIQLAQDTANQLNSSPIPASASNKVDISKSLAPFIIVYDKQGKALTGNGYLDNSLAKIPVGVLEAANSKPYNAVTWQPNSDTRIAAVAVKADNFYVLSGRSLVEVEKRENQIMMLAVVGWLLSLVTVASGYLYLRGSGK